MNDQIVLNILKEGTTSISNLLITNYHKLGILDQEMMLIVHLLYFQNRGNFFPSISELEKRMSLNTEEIMRLLQRLVRTGYINIEENVEESTGFISEKYNLEPLYYKLIKELERSVEVSQISKTKKVEKEQKLNVFNIFEQEFGRPLSPMEIELINTWIDNDKYNTEIIVYALKEAVFSNKLNMRYIDKILFEWEKKNVRTIEQIKEHIKYFRNHQGTLKQDSESKNSNDMPSFEFYNWLENE